MASQPNASLHHKKGVVPLITILDGFQSLCSFVYHDLQFSAYVHTQTGLKYFVINVKGQTQASSSNDVLKRYFVLLAGFGLVLSLLALPPFVSLRACIQRTPARDATTTTFLLVGDASGLC